MLYRIFEYKPDKLGKVTAVLRKTKHKKGVPVYKRTYTQVPLRVIMIIKNWSKGLYEYTVNDKKYKIHYVDHVTPHQMPLAVQVTYFKKIPKIAYVKTNTNFHHFEIYSFAALMFAVVSAAWALMVLL